MNKPQQEGTKRLLLEEQERFTRVVEKLFATEIEIYQITKQDFIEKYLVRLTEYVKSQGFNPLEATMKELLESGTDNVLRQKNANKGI